MSYLTFSRPIPLTGFPKTGKDEYDASRKEDEKEPAATGSIFQGLRADIEGYSLQYFLLDTN